MFGIGMPELILIMAIALIVIGPKKLPDLARSLGRAMGEFKKATGELKSSLGVDDELGDVKQAFDEMNQDIKEAVNINPLDPAKKPTEKPLPDETKKTDPVGEATEETAASDATIEDSAEAIEKSSASVEGEDREPVSTTTDTKAEGVSKK